MKERIFTKTLLSLFAFLSLSLFHSCDSVETEDYMSKLVGTWVSTEEYEDGELVGSDELETLTWYVFSDYTFHLRIRSAGSTSDLNYTNADAVFEIVGNKILMVATERNGTGELDYMWEILSLTDTELWIINDRSGLANEIRTKFVKQ